MHCLLAAPFIHACTGGCALIAAIARKDYNDTRRIQCIVGWLHGVATDMLRNLCRAVQNYAR